MQNTLPVAFLKIKSQLDNNASKTIIRFEKISISFTVSKQVAVSISIKFLWRERGFFRKGLCMVSRHYTAIQNNEKLLSVLQREWEQRSGKSRALCTFAESEMSSQNGDRYSNSPARIKSNSSSWSGLKWKMMISAQNWTQHLDEEILFWSIGLSKWWMILCKVKPSKWRESTKENVCNYSSCPDINLKTIPTNKKTNSHNNNKK